MEAGPSSNSAAGKINPRAYQLELLEESLRGNIIIALETGSGKTHIAILRMKAEVEREPVKVCWFITPTVMLCDQQKHAIATCLPVPVAKVNGQLQPDQWKDRKMWRSVISSHRIVVSTPQVLLDALRHGYISLASDISLLIFDEAHHAVDDHPYNRIMVEFYHTLPRVSIPSEKLKRPSILGLTASPITGGKNIHKAFM
jgi:endoribonuclease Dicer